MDYYCCPRIDTGSSPASHRLSPMSLALKIKYGNLKCWVVFKIKVFFGDGYGKWLSVSEVTCHNHTKKHFDFENNPTFEVTILIIKL